MKLDTGRWSETEVPRFPEPSLHNAFGGAAAVACFVGWVVWGPPHVPVHGFVPCLVFTVEAVEDVQEMY